jgi:hypothetical protein
MTPQVEIALAVAALLIIVTVIYVMYGGSKPACTLDTDCTAPQTCVSGICTDPVVCNPACVLPQSCVAGTCTAPIACTNDQLSKIGLADDLASECKATADGKWMAFDASANYFNKGATNQLPDYPKIPLNECQDKCFNDPLCTSFTFGAVSNDCWGYKGRPTIIDDEFYSAYAKIS